MSECGQEKKRYTFSVRGHKMEFSKEELTAIIEDYFSKESNERKVRKEEVLVPVEDQWFEVKPQNIDQSLFLNKLEDEVQEDTRKLIMEAFVELRRNPEKYGRNFKTMMPKKTWISKTVGELEEMACELGDHLADWVEQALEWAQRICNGESWETICNNPDTAMSYRLVAWKNGNIRLVGGSSVDDYDFPATCVYYDVFFSHLGLFNATPLVVSYEK